MKAPGAEGRHNPGGVGVEPEIPPEAAQGVADIDAGDSAGRKQTGDHVPDTVQQKMHGREGGLTVSVFQKRPNFSLLSAEEIVPHGNHGIGGRRYQERGSFFGYLYESQGIA